MRKHGHNFQFGTNENKFAASLRGDQHSSGSNEGGGGNAPSIEKGHSHIGVAHESHDWLAGFRFDFDEARNHGSHDWHLNGRTNFEFDFSHSENNNDSWSEHSKFERSHDHDWGSDAVSNPHTHDVDEVPPPLYIDTPDGGVQVNPAIELTDWLIS
jgi:hypothetical protein